MTQSSDYDITISRAHVTIQLLPIVGPKETNHMPSLTNRLWDTSRGGLLVCRSGKGMS